MNQWNDVFIINIPSPHRSFLYSLWETWSIMNKCPPELEVALCTVQRQNVSSCETATHSRFLLFYTTKRKGNPACVYRFPILKKEKKSSFQLRRIIVILRRISYLYVSL
jgi:hypothetical protein